MDLDHRFCLQDVGWDDKKTPSHYHLRGKDIKRNPSTFFRHSPAI